MATRATTLAAGVAVLMLCMAPGCSRKEGDTSPAENIRKGWTSYRLGEYKRAALTFEAARDAIPETEPDHLMALYGLATTWNLRMPIGDQNKAMARALYDRIIELDATHDLAAWSLLARARMLHLVAVGQAPDYDAVRQAYAVVYTQHPEHHAGHEAFIYSQATLVQTWERESAAQAVENLQSFIERYPASAMLSAAHDVLAAAFQVVGEPRGQLAALVAGLEALVLNPDNPVQENSQRYWFIASLAEFEVGDFDTARRFYQRLLDEYPQDIRCYPAESAFRRMSALEQRLRGSTAEGGQP